MKYDIIQTDSYLIIVDDSEIKEGDFYLRYNNSVLRCTQLKESFNEALNKNEIIILANGCGDPYERSRDYIKKIIAHLPVNNSPILKGVPLLPPLEQEDDVNKLAENEYREYPNNPKDKPDWHYNKDIHCHKKRKAFIKGYNKSREVYKYTEEDLRMAIQMAQILKFDEGKYVGLFFYSDEIIQSLSQPKYPIAFEQGNIVDGKNYISVTRRHDDFTLWIGKYIY